MSSVDSSDDPVERTLLLPLLSHLYHKSFPNSVSFRVKSKPIKKQADTSVLAFFEAKPTLELRNLLIARYNGQNFDAIEPQFEKATPRRTSNAEEEQPTARK
jgi:hypothetical protein